jgi:cytochrome d ubiquinol oxidase subunit II
LIFVVVLLFGGFPSAYATASVALHLPLTAMLVGIVFRGSAFTFRHYGGGAAWGRVFAVASVITPIFLGVIVAAVTGETVRSGAPGSFVEIYVQPWLGLFPLAVGLLTLALFAFLAAVYLTCETADAAVREDFRARAVIAGVAVGAFALGAGLAVPRGSHFVRAFVGSWWTWPLHVLTGVVAIGALVALLVRRFRLARALAVSQTVLILVGWALAQRPFLIAPDVTIAGAAAPEGTLVLLLGASIAGGTILIPSLYWLFRVFRHK